MELILSCQKRQYPSEEKKKKSLFASVAGFQAAATHPETKNQWLSSGELCYYLNQNPDTNLPKQLFDLENLKRIQKQKHGKHSVNMKSQRN